MGLLLIPHPPLFAQQSSQNDRKRALRPIDGRARACFRITVVAVTDVNVRFPEKWIDVKDDDDDVHPPEVGNEQSLMAMALRGKESLLSLPPSLPPSANRRTTTISITMRKKQAMRVTIVCAAV